jgi:hypothetical protein
MAGRGCSKNGVLERPMSGMTMMSWNDHTLASVSSFVTKTSRCEDPDARRKAGHDDGKDGVNGK